MSERIGKYELKRLVATGGMAEIWIASQTGPAGFARELAIKRILPHLARDERFTSMFLDEASIASKLTHPNIAQIFELGQVDGEYFIAMEFIDGMDLADILDDLERKRQFMPLSIAVRITIDILNALDFAHKFEENGRPLGVVHRDVSPHNLLVSKNGVVKLVDFGVAKAVERHSKTQTGLVKGKLSYMAPEQIEQADVDRRADVFGVGVLLFEALTNVTPFGRELTAISAILNDDPPDARAFRSDVPHELVRIINRALEKNADDRYPDAAEMARDLERYLRQTNELVGPREVGAFLHALGESPAPQAVSQEATVPDIPSGLKALADSSSETVTHDQPLIEFPNNGPRIPTQTAMTETHTATGPVLVLLGAAAVLAAITFGVFGDDATSTAAPREDRISKELVVEEDAPEAMIFEETEEAVGLYVDEQTGETYEVVEEDLGLDADLETLWRWSGVYHPSELLVHERIARLELEESDAQRWDPGDPGVVAVLDLPRKTKRAKPTKKRRIKRKVKPKRKSSKKSKPKRSTKKKKTQDLKRIDNAIPNF